ncbi:MULTISPECIES: GNAT family N-acetyltransferase [Salegentibacter]|uniref:N-acetyltransferase n=1 Tax=Salegentibacter maritimus TaxID=2794347 RepID=A0ABS0TEZ1_9FLAO|nr:MULTISPECIES: GNAT family N-acetyltransferase [Salegentibacter]MBE7640882.1 GNAT family N-acetyltransferase [Salegentibacter sp. BLCTC]MBI6117985.1 N-acetyltransferase [Salegentibacter maritimus]MBI6119588.1 N-acetyltransferase [Salegentibacter maritimus]
MDIQHRENDSRGMFFIKDEKGIFAELTYQKKSGDIIVIDHTEVRPELEGQGIATRLLEHSVAFARENNYKIEPLCPFAEVQFDRNKSYSDVRA